MAYTLPQFSAACRRILAEDPGPAGRKKICLLLQDVLRDESFVAAHLTDDTPDRQIIYEDKELGFCILAHAYQGAKASAPHDHGPSWAIYGQARGETEMSDWTLVAPFARRVLRATSRIPYGGVLSYAEVAADAGSPRGFRAAGNALGANPIPIVVPCHRVLRSGGALGGYGGGLERKRFLLQLEGAPVLAR